MQRDPDKAQAADPVGTMLWARGEGAPNAVRLVGALNAVRLVE